MVHPRPSQLIIPFKEQEESFLLCEAHTKNQPKTDKTNPRESSDKTILNFLSYKKAKKTLQPC